MTPARTPGVALHVSVMPAGSFLKSLSGGSGALVILLVAACACALAVPPARADVEPVQVPTEAPKTTPPAPAPEDKEAPAEGESGPDAKAPSDASRSVDEVFRPRNREPRLVHTEPPQYPSEFAGTGMTAEVMVSVMVDRRGKATHVRVEDSPDKAFTEAALDALANWDFLPAIKNGKVTNAPMEITVLVAEELGDASYFEYKGGRITLEGTRYAGEYDEPVRRLRGLRPAFPFDMLAERTPGEVLIEFDIAEAGEPHNYTIVESSHPDFTNAVKGAVTHWRYSPAMSIGRNVPVRLRYRISFQPDDFDDEFLKLATDIRDGRPTTLVAARDVDVQPRVTRYLQPMRPTGIELSGRRQRVTVNLVISETGEVQLPRVVSINDPLVEYIALAAVSYWRFTPARRDGRTVPVTVSVPVGF